jgi:hypothetical protein
MCSITQSKIFRNMPRVLPQGDLLEESIFHTEFWQNKRKWNEKLRKPAVCRQWKVMNKENYINHTTVKTVAN